MYVLKSRIFTVVFVITLLLFGAFFLLITYKLPPTPSNNSVKEPLTSPTSSVYTLDLSAQSLDKLPEYVLSYTLLEELIISNNNITGALPAEIRNLKNLKVLDASNNNMTGVPAEVGQLSNLEVLNLSNNKLTGLPYELGNLKNLQILDLSGNDYAKADLDVIKKGLPSNIKIIY
ncbi:leucine-rich repeat domain-containing protein [candidate division WWE3 bacterium]|uniref:Leucine-rich repeat domain-containing protein n=1 Tax=candidate division WWE3 bacterium TaxID=2053526 RepID=A0A955EB97_UNCKA|nr:leucine-rich repeat domain-containing protein [candidate division WWE3 bacterium]